MSEKKKTIFARALKETWDVVKVFVITYAVLFFAFHYLVRPVTVKGTSMYPTLSNADYGLANIYDRNLNGIDRFDIVIIYLENRGEYLVKRAVGLPGETIECIDDVIYINGNPINEAYLDTDYVEQMKKQNGYFTTDFGPVKLGYEEYFCLGDNRPNSRDSRYYGPFKFDSITCKLRWLFWPFNHFGKIEE